MRIARRLTIALLLVMTAQAVLGLVIDSAYRDVEWIEATWFGNDLVTLVVAAPLLLLGLVLATAGSTRGLLVWLGVTGYAVYNYAFYLFGAALNAFFPLYVAGVVLAAMTLVLGLSNLDVPRLAERFGPDAPVRLVGGILAFVGSGLGFVWLAMWFAHVFAGRPTPVATDAFRLVAALDLSMMVPALIAGGVMVWRRRPWGFVVAAMASIQGALYLLVLSTNSVVLMQRGLVSPPGELPAWAPLMLLMSGAVLLLMKHVRRSRS